MSIVFALTFEFALFCKKKNRNKFRILDEILNLIESVSEGFPSYSSKKL